MISLRRKSIYNREELISKSLECQGEYYKSCKSNTFNIDKAFKLAEIIEDESGKIIEASLLQLFSLMQSYSDEIGKELIGESPQKAIAGKVVLLGIKHRDVIEQTLSLKNISFDNWVDEDIVEDKLKFLLKVIYRESNSRLTTKLPQLLADDKYKEGDIDYLYEKLSKKYSL